MKNEYPKTSIIDIQIILKQIQTLTPYDKCKDASLNHSHAVHMCGSNINERNPFNKDGEKMTKITNSEDEVREKLNLYTI